MTQDMTLAEGLTLYRQKVSVLKKGFVQESYRISSLLKSQYADKNMRDFRSPDIASLRDQRLSQTNPKTGLPISPSTVRLEMSLLSNVFDIGRIEWGVCESNPVSNVRKPKAAPGRDRRLTAREERQIMRYCHAHPTPDLYVLVVLAIETAMRQGELLKLEWEHISLQRRIAHLPDTKNGSKRDVPLSLKARDALIQLGARTKGKVFGYTANGLKSAWRIMLQRLEIKDLHFHDLRHEACSRLFELGTLDIMEIAAISGHKSLAMLKRYTHLKASRLVKKLEGNKHRGQQVIINHLVPYPAVVSETPSGVTVRVLDFEGVQGAGRTAELAKRVAQDALLRHLMVSLRDKEPIPAPDQYLEQVNEGDIIMLDPLSQNPPLEEAHTFLG
ncbi:tyrosine-type recombinase/integrase [Pseudomonas gorinensis]|jgi:integrase/predicted RNase H-like HicB family nuclease|uniref:tyrosine-type recombinase/integrase n=1 Tax=Pseudomonas gorinensis TaxID=3240790 RepID=UPI003D64D4A7